MEGKFKPGKKYKMSRKNYIKDTGSKDAAWAVEADGVPVIVINENEGHVPPNIDEYYPNERFSYYWVCRAWCAEVRK